MPTPAFTCSARASRTAILSRTAGFTLSCGRCRRSCGNAPTRINFDAKVRRQSIDPEDMFYGHVGAMDVCARALLVA